MYVSYSFLGKLARLSNVKLEVPFLVFSEDGEA